MAGFTWEVRESGYEVVEASLADMPAVATPHDDRRVIRPRPGGGVKTTAPLADVPDLFLKFLHLESTAEAYVGFAREYGLLGLEQVGDGELLSEWSEQVRVVSGVFWRWEIREGTLDWDKARAFVGPEYIMRTTDPRQQPTTANPAVFKQGQKDHAAFKVSLLHQVTVGINVGLRRFCSYGASPREDGTLAWDQWPDTLIGVIWLQLLWHVMGKYRWHVCPRRNCQNWVGNAPDRRGHPQRFCRPACKVAYLKAERRKKDAERRRKGKSARLASGKGRR